MTVMRYERLTTQSPDFNAVVELYLSAFPEEERRPVAAFRNIVEQRGGVFSLLAAYDGSTFVGFATCWDFPPYRYVEHLAVKSASRGCGYGGLIVEEIKRAGRPVLLEVERPTTEQACRRIRFYEKHGFVLSDYPYTQPPYRPGGREVPMYLMVANGASLCPLSRETLVFIRREVYGMRE